MGLLEFIFDALSYTPVWVGIGLGILTASIAWYFLPDTMDRASIGGWAIAIGFLGGLIFCYPSKGTK